ncbi:MAG TPA: 4-hydroxythreonine-4-phosphate dehydrogenase PdxA [Gemmatimonadales bacterium]|jgi:4-hydroxythreonine-4-phosphate dehydrogenase|nr:4-hydroxythreonine-4-phosphate dehydrogenase PdxA [Gemmatimonadales bacterium]
MSPSPRAGGTDRPRLAVTLGDPRGIGPEVVAKALRESVAAHVTVIGAADQIEAVSADAHISVGNWCGGAGEHGGDRARAVRAGQLAGHALQRAARLALEGSLDAIVTGPVEKHALHAAGFPYPGQTEWLGQLAGVEVAMMLASGALRVVLVTTHVALRDVPLLLTTERIIQAGRITRAALIGWFGIAEPRLALCALNPHAGEQGLFGDEEARILLPAAQALGAAGPLPADTVFVRALRGEFDAVLAPYHDVGMTAVKVAGFGQGVNLTLGLPFIRTSPDHGTALDIAGQQRADAGSMRAALELAVELAGKANQEIRESANQGSRGAGELPGPRTP